MTIYVIALACFLGDCILAYHLYKERHRHSYTRAALRFWQRGSHE